MRAVLRAADKQLSALLTVPPCLEDRPFRVCTFNVGSLLTSYTSVPVAGMMAKLDLDVYGIQEHRFGPWRRFMRAADLFNLEHAVGRVIAITDRNSFEANFGTCLYLDTTKSRLVHGGSLEAAAASGAAHSRGSVAILNNGVAIVNLYMPHLWSSQYKDLYKVLLNETIATVSELKELGFLPVIMGDLNHPHMLSSNLVMSGIPYDAACRYFERVDMLKRELIDHFQLFDALGHSEEPSFSSFGGSFKIDFVLCDDALRKGAVKSKSFVLNTMQGSDHFPVIAEWELWKVPELVDMERRKRVIEYFYTARVLQQYTTWSLAEKKHHVDYPRNITDPELIHNSSSLSRVGTFQKLVAPKVTCVPVLETQQLMIIVTKDSKITPEVFDFFYDAGAIEATTKFFGRTRLLLRKLHKGRGYISWLIPGECTLELLHLMRESDVLFGGIVWADPTVHPETFDAFCSRRPARDVLPPWQDWLLKKYRRKSLRARTCGGTDDGLPEVKHTTLRYTELELVNTESPPNVRGAAPVTSMPVPVTFDLAKEPAKALDLVLASDRKAYLNLSAKDREEDDDEIDEEEEDFVEPIAEERIDDEPAKLSTDADDNAEEFKDTLFISDDTSGEGPRTNPYTASLNEILETRDLRPSGSLTTLMDSSSLLKFMRAVRRSQFQDSPNAFYEKIHSRMEATSSEGRCYAARSCVGYKPPLGWRMESTHPPMAVREFVGQLPKVVNQPVYIKMTVNWGARFRERRLRTTLPALEERPLSQWRSGKVGEYQPPVGGMDHKTQLLLRSAEYRDCQDLPTPTVETIGRVQKYGYTSDDEGDMPDAGPDLAAA